MRVEQHFLTERTLPLDVLREGFAQLQVDRLAVLGHGVVHAVDQLIVRVTVTAELRQDVKHTGGFAHVLRDVGFDAVQDALLHRLDVFVKARAERRVERGFEEVEADHARRHIEDRTVEVFLDVRGQFRLDGGDVLADLVGDVDALPRQDDLDHALADAAHRIGVFAAILEGISAAMRIDL